MTTIYVDRQRRSNMRNQVHATSDRHPLHQQKIETRYTVRGHATINPRFSTSTPPPPLSLIFIQLLSSRQIPNISFKQLQYRSLQTTITLRLHSDGIIVLLASILLFAFPSTRIKAPPSAQLPTSFIGKSIVYRQDIWTIPTS